MEHFIRFWIPLGALIISVVSHIISVSNKQFVKRYEAAKKRTEFLPKILQTIAVLRSKKDQLFLVKDICAGCQGNQADKICNDYDQFIDDIEKQYRDYEEMLLISDPIFMCKNLDYI